MKVSSFGLWVVLILLLVVVGIASGCNEEPGAEGVTTTGNTSTTGTGGDIPPEEAQAVNAAPPGAEAVKEDGREVIDCKDDYPVQFDFEFTSTQHDGKPGELSTLNFEFILSQDDVELTSDRLTLTASEAKGSCVLDLPEYRIELTPKIDAPIELDKNSYGSYGGYLIKLYTPELKPMAEILVDKVGNIKVAEGLGGHRLRVLLAAPTENLYTYGVLSTDEKSVEPLLALDIEIPGFTPRTTVDGSDESSYQYRFPEVSLKVYSERLAKEMQLTRGTNQQAVTSDPFNGLGVVL